MIDFAQLAAKGRMVKDQVAIWGVDNLLAELPLRGWPEGRIEFRFRNDDYATAFVHTQNATIQYYAAIRDAAIVPGNCIAVYRAENIPTRRRWWQFWKHNPATQQEA